MTYWKVLVPQWRAGRNVLFRDDVVSQDFLAGALGPSRVDSARRLGFIEETDPPGIAEDLWSLTKAELLDRLDGVEVPARATKIELIELLES